MKRIEIKEGDRLTVTACYFQVPDWMDNQPTVLLSPGLIYDETCSSECLIEDFLEHLTVFGFYDFHTEENVNESLKWVGKSLKSLTLRVNKSLKTREKPYKSMWSEITSVEIEIYRDAEGFQYRELNRIKI